MKGDVGFEFGFPPEEVDEHPPVKIASPSKADANMGNLIRSPKIHSPEIVPSEIQVSSASVLCGVHLDSAPPVHDAIG